MKNKCISVNLYESLCWWFVLCIMCYVFMYQCNWREVVQPNSVLLFGNSQQVNYNGHHRGTLRTDNKDLTAICNTGAEFRVSTVAFHNERLCCEPKLRTTAAAPILLQLSQTMSFFFFSNSWTVEFGVRFGYVNKEFQRRGLVWFMEPEVWVEKFEVWKLLRHHSVQQYSARLKQWVQDFSWGSKWRLICTNNSELTEYKAIIYIIQIFTFS